jgi:hypothetical protein
MDRNSFWLADINNKSVTVSLVRLSGGNYQISSLGMTVPYSDDDGLIRSFDQSLSQAASAINLPDSQESDEVALIIPPFWVDSDGAIIPQKKSTLGRVLNSLKLKPMGFISNDEALVEEANQSDGFPASFVIANFFDNEVAVSLSYLGKIIKRSVRTYQDQFNPAILEEMLLGFNSESALPPQIIVTGDVSDLVLDSIRNFAWTGKKNVETFLHFPEIKFYDLSKTTSIYLKTICSQFRPDVSGSVIDSPTPVEEIIDDNLETTQEVVLEDLSEDSSLLEVDPSELGFSHDTATPIILDYDQVSLDAPLSAPEKPEKKFNFPKIRAPAFNPKFLSVKYLLYPLVLSPLLILIPFFFSKATITIHITPYSFSKSLKATFDTEAKEVDSAKGIIPINRKVVEVSTSLSSAATGTKVVGDKSTGEVVIYNKQDKVQPLSKGTILTDTTGRRYELTTSAQIASSSANLDLGVINLGQTKVMVSAADIGPEYNLGKDSKLVFKDFPESVLVAKVSQGLVGGTKNEARAVSAVDKANLEQQISSKIDDLVEQRLNQEITNTPGIIKDATQIKNSRLDYNREVGELSEDLTVTSNNSIYIFYLSPDQKSRVLSSFLDSEEGFLDSRYSLDDFEINLNNPSKTVDRITSQIIISGKSIPRIDTSELIKQVSGKNKTKAISLITKSYPRVYDYNIETNFNFLATINPLPFRLQNIKIEVK